MDRATDRAGGNRVPRGRPSPSAPARLVLAIEGEREPLRAEHRRESGRFEREANQRLLRDVVPGLERHEADLAQAEMGALEHPSGSAMKKPCSNPR